MSQFPFVQMEVVERSQYDGGTYFLIQTASERDGWEVAEVRPDIPWQLKTAQLLAAAPELLEALELWLADYDEWAANPDFEPHAHIALMVAKTRAAIAKAKGEKA